MIKPSRTVRNSDAHRRWPVASVGQARAANTVLIAKAPWAHWNSIILDYPAIAEGSRIGSCTRHCPTARGTLNGSAWLKSP
jgi:hypothetical protein